MNNIPCPYCHASIEADSIYCDHCGKKLPQQAATSSTSPHLTLVNKENNMRLTLTDGNTIGRRSPETHQLATFANISGNHAQVRKTANGNWTLTDKGSTNGTWINNQRLPPETPQIIHKGDIVQLASVQFVVE